ncbi:MAG: Deoxyribodipyrimidine photolyase, partial [Pseudomonadota bacterium]
GVDALFFNHDYEPAAIARDASVSHALQQAGRAVFSFKDQVIYEKNQILTQSGTPFSVFTPYKNAWLKRLQQEGLHHHACQAKPGQWLQIEGEIVPTLPELGFEAIDIAYLHPGMQGAQTLWQNFQQRLSEYGERRDFPARKGPSYLSVHLRFGTISIRQLVLHAWQHGSEGSSSVWLSELIWREFYAMILFTHPHVAERAFKPAYDAIQWESGALAQSRFEAWCQGQTGYPLVDAAMLQLNRTGYMHNRLRMVTASFLIKDCGIDWRWGEAYFATHLNDFDLAANNGGWQWCASSGCDAQPYFRIFNPITQSQKFDEQGEFIVRYLPQLAALAPKYRHAPWLAPVSELARAKLLLGQDYPLPILQHDVARQATLARYAVVKADDQSGRNIALAL